MTLARPAETLEDHIRSCHQVFLNEFSFLSLLDKDLYDSLSFAIIWHDLGKMNEYFQRSFQESVGRVPHSPLSAFFVYYLLRDKSSRSLEAFYSVYLHHQSPKGILELIGFLERSLAEISSEISRRANHCYKYIVKKGMDTTEFLSKLSGIDKSDVLNALSFLRNEENVSNLIKEIIIKIKEELSKEAGRECNFSHTNLYWRFLFSYSVLKYCDELSVSPI